MIKAKLGDRLDAWLEAALPFLFRQPIHPNVLSILGAVVSLGAGVAFAEGALRVGGALVLGGGFFDLVDGVVARHQGRATIFGAFLDSTLDRLVDLALLLGIMVHYAASGDSGLVLLAGVALGASVLTSYAKARAERYVPLRGGLFERGERVIVLAAGALTGTLIVALWVVAVLGTVTVIQRFAMAYRALEGLEGPAARSEVGEHRVHERA